MHIITIKDNTIAKLTADPKDSGVIGEKQKVFLPKGTQLQLTEILDHKAQHLQCIILPNDIFCQATTAWLFIPHLDTKGLPDDLFYLLPLDKLLAMGVNRELALLYHEGLNVAFQEFDIKGCKRISNFLAQVFHESGGLKWHEELASGQAYEGRKDLGNVYAGDGKRFKGRGLIQLTGRHNYRVAGQALNLDLINRPEIASSPANAPRIAGWYWNSRDLNRFADQHNISAFQTITRRINGGLNGYKDRLYWWGITRKVLGC